MRKIPVTRPYMGMEEKNAAAEAIDSGWIAQGPRVAEFEKALASHEGIRYGVASSSCTTALQLAMAVEGLGAGMDAIVPSFTFVATANSVVSTGAVPVLVDVKRDTYNIDPERVQEKIQKDYRERDGKLINQETGNVLWGIVPVHQFGLCCDIPAINRIAEEHHLKVIEDAACALGAQISGTHQGAFGNISCVSFHPRKSISTGEGGMVFTDREDLAGKMRALRTHGASAGADARDKGKGFLLPSFDMAGFNYRMTDIQAAIGLVQAKKLDDILGEKRRMAGIYREILADAVPELILPVEPEGYYHTYQSFVCMLDLEKLGNLSVEEGGVFRNRLLDELETEDGIASRQGTHAVHTLGYYVNRFHYKMEEIPNAYACDRLSITLPLYVGLSESDQAYVASKLREKIDRLKG